MNEKIILNNRSNKDFIALTQASKNHLKEIRIDNAEIVKVNDRPIHYPCDRVAVSTQDFKQVEHGPHNSDPRQPAANDHLIQIHKLHPPIIINLRNDATPGHQDTREILTTEEIHYLRRNSSMAILFIHGFNVAYGEYSRQILGLNKASLSPLDRQATLDDQAKVFKFSQSASTILKTQSSLENIIGPNLTFNFKLSDEDLNGSGAHNWFVHMEHNINSAAERIKGQDYSEYLRMINIAWSGDILPLAYLDAEELADSAGQRLVKVLMQLVEEKMHVYIIAHSLGTRVLLTAMELLALNSHENSLKQVFLWQAAVPNTCLSNNPKQDHSVKFNSHFPNAHLTTGKIMVLYSQNDWVLHLEYWLANRMGLTPKELLSDPNAIKLLYRFMDQDPIELMSLTKLVEGDINLKHSLKTSEHNVDLALRLAIQLYRLPKISLAMGYRGVELKDPFTQQLVKRGKLIQVNQPHLKAHSAMKIPSEEVMQLSYKRWVVNKTHGIPCSI